MGSYHQEGAGFSLFAWVEVDRTVHGSQSYHGSPAGEWARGKSVGLSHLLTFPRSDDKGRTGEGEVRKCHYKVQVPLGTPGPALSDFCDIEGAPAVHPEPLSNALFVNMILKNIFKNAFEMILVFPHCWVLREL